MVSHGVNMWLTSTRPYSRPGPGRAWNPDCVLPRVVHVGVGQPLRVMSVHPHCCGHSPGRHTIRAACGSQSGAMVNGAALDALGHGLGGRTRVSGGSTPREDSGPAHAQLSHVLSDHLPVCLSSPCSHQRRVSTGPHPRQHWVFSVFSF